MEGLAVGDKLLVRYGDADQWFHATVINVATVAGRTRGVGERVVRVHYAGSSSRRWDESIAVTSDRLRRALPYLEQWGDDRVTTRRRELLEQNLRAVAASPLATRFELPVGYARATPLDFRRRRGRQKRRHYRGTNVPQSGERSESSGGFTSDSRR